MISKKFKPYPGQYEAQQRRGCRNAPAVRLPNKDSPAGEGTREGKKATTRSNIITASQMEIGCWAGAGAGAGLVLVLGCAGAGAVLVLVLGCAGAGAVLVLVLGCAGAGPRCSKTTKDLTEDD